MNPLQILTSMIQQQVKMKNPQAFQQVQNLIKNQSNPQEFLNQLIGNQTAEQRNNFIKFLNGYGVTQDQLDQYGIKSK